MNIALGARILLFPANSCLGITLLGDFMAPVRRIRHCAHRQTTIRYIPMQSSNASSSLATRLLTNELNFPSPPFLVSFHRVSVLHPFLFSSFPCVPVFPLFTDEQCMKHTSFGPLSCCFLALLRWGLPRGDEANCAIIGKSLWTSGHYMYAILRWACVLKLKYEYGAMNS